MRIAIDGTAAAGKGTLAKRLAEKFSYSYIDTGALYRGVALIALQKGVSWDEEKELAALAQTLVFSFETNERGLFLFCDGYDITQAIRSDQISKGASIVSACAGVRSALLEVQKKLAAQPNVIMDGRDIGTVIMPDADIKFYVDAAVEIRAQRRWMQQKEKNQDLELSEVLDALKKRDIKDQTREHAPLVQAHDAILIDTSTSTIEQSLDVMARHIQGQ